MAQISCLSSNSLQNASSSDEIRLIKCAIVSEAENSELIEHDISGPYASPSLQPLDSNNPSSPFIRQAYSHFSIPIIRLSFKMDFTRFQSENASSLILAIAVASAQNNDIQCTAETWYKGSYDSPCALHVGQDPLDDLSVFSTILVQLPSHSFLHAAAGNHASLSNTFIPIHLQSYDQDNTSQASLMLVCEFAHIRGSNEVVVDQIADSTRPHRPLANGVSRPLSESFEEDSEKGLHRHKPHLSVAIPAVARTMSGGLKMPGWNVSTPLDQRIDTPVNPPPISRVPARKQMERYLGTPTDPYSPADMRHSPTHFGNLPLSHLTLDAMAAGTPKYLREIESLPLASPLGASLSFPGFQRSSTPGDYFPRTY